MHDTKGEAPLYHTPPFQVTTFKPILYFNKPSLINSMAVIYLLKNYRYLSLDKFQCLKVSDC